MRLFPAEGRSLFFCLWGAYGRQHVMVGHGESWQVVRQDDDY